jgi:hypothetical protein
MFVVLRKPAHVDATLAAWFSRVNAIPSPISMTRRVRLPRAVSRSCNSMYDRLHAWVVADAEQQ